MDAERTTLADVITARVEAGRVLMLYPGPSGTWLGEDDELSFFQFPARAGGWADRKPFSRSAIVGMSSVGVHNAAGTGWAGLEMPQ